MGYTLDNAMELRRVASQSLTLSSDITDTVTSFQTGCNAIGNRCEELWPGIEASAETSGKIAKDSAIVLSEYANLMQKMAEKMESIVKES